MMTASWHRLTWLGLCWLVIGMCLCGSAVAQSAGRNFDHLRTGFSLGGAHASARCESCHVGGVFKGTPRDCESCHVSGARFTTSGAVKTATHLPTQQVCASCHNTRSFVGARMSHDGVTKGACATCHNGVQAPGKGANHLRTGASCDTCHATSAWRPAMGFDHAGVSPGSCATCHNGVQAVGRGASHVPHTQVAATASAACDSCHKAGFRSWMPARVHANFSLTAQCTSCHASIKPANATHAGQTVCETCHRSTTSWSGARVDHSTYTAATDCAGCHNGSNATGKHAAHIPSGATNCSTCHATSGWRPSRFNHTQVPVTAQCASCHTGGFEPADGKPANHTPYQLVAASASANCDTCHKAGYTSWTPAKVHSNVTMTAQCASCHAAIKPTNATHAGQTVCETCHRSTTAWTGTRVDHSTYTAATDCAGCHNGSNATGKHATHIPSATTSCISCHSTTGWRPSRFNHTQVPVTAQCASCHTGGLEPADGKPANHTPYQLVASSASANCDTCHKAGFTSWTPAKVHSNVTMTAQCASCHAAIKPTNATHAGQTVCETCHRSTSAWTGTRVDHSAYTAATDCAGCHNGSNATGKHATHIPSATTSCISCHSTTGWRPSRFNHTQVPVTAQCASCHSGAYPPADGKPANHTPYQLVAASASANCDTCHKAGFTSWTPAKVHSNVTMTAQCASCHAAIKPTNATHAGQTVCETCHRSTTSWIGARVDHSTYTAATDCAGCHNGSNATGKHATHIPSGATNCSTCHATSGWRPSRFNHTQVPVTAQCASCHSGAYPPADGKPANHTPYQLVAASASANCDTCHKAGFTSWTPARVHSNVTMTAQCATCHLSIKPTNATHAGQTVCETCHRSTTSWIGARVDHSTYTAATDCAGCHNGSNASGKHATHIPSGVTNCISCHSTTGWRPSRFNHTQVPVTAQCASCHSGAYPPADGKPANHTPYQLVAASASANCDTCHKAGFTSWTPAKVHSNVTMTAQCATCHLSIKPTNATHAGQTVCETCHRSTTTWLGARVDHSTYTAATNCAGCHNGSNASGKHATHIPSGTTNCISCHSTTGWRPSRFNHTQVPVTAQCASCHSGAYPPADGKPASHTPYQLVAASASANCDTCHKAGFTSWTPARVHSNVTMTAQCATCHLSIKPTNATHAGQTVCETCHRSTTTWLGARVDHSTYTAATNCAGCHNGSNASGKHATHIPSGVTNCISCHSTTGWRPSRFNHTQVPVTAQCASCHSGAYPPADGKPANHIPYQLVASASSANCDTCHRGGFASWAGGRTHANVSITGQCKTCHNGSYTAQGATAKPANHVPETQLLNGAAMECNACHTSTTGWTARMNHNNSMGGGAGWCKGCHASGLNYNGGERKSLTHRTKTPPAIDCSEAGCHRPLGTKGTTYREWD